MINSTKHEIETNLKNLLKTSVNELMDYNSFSMYVGSKVNEEQIINSINGFLKIENNIIVSKIELASLKCIIMDVYNVDVSA